MKEVLNFRGDDYNLLTTFFTLGYLVGQIPSQLLLARRKYSILFCQLFKGQQPRICQCHISLSEGSQSVLLARNSLIQIYPFILSISVQVHNCLLQVLSFTKEHSPSLPLSSHCRTPLDNRHLLFCICENY